MLWQSYLMKVDHAIDCSVLVFDQILEDPLLHQDTEYKYDQVQKENYASLDCVKCWSIVFHF